MVKNGEPNAAFIAGVGDAATFTFEVRVSTATVRAYVAANGEQVSLAFHGGNALSSMDKPAELLVEVVAAL